GAASLDGAVRCAFARKPPRYAQPSTETDWARSAGKWRCLRLRVRTRAAPLATGRRAALSTPHNEAAGQRPAPPAQLRAETGSRPTADGAQRAAPADRHAHASSAGRSAGPSTAARSANTAPALPACAPAGPRA